MYVYTYTCIICVTYVKYNIDKQVEFIAGTYDWLLLENQCNSSC